MGAVLPGNDLKERVPSYPVCVGVGRVIVTVVTTPELFLCCSAPDTHTPMSLNSSLTSLHSKCGAGVREGDSPGKQVQGQMPGPLVLSTVFPTNSHHRGGGGEGRK